MRDKTRDAARPEFGFDRRSTPITAGAVLAIALVVSVIGSYVTYISIRSAFAQHTAFESARSDLSTLLQLQLEEETGLRGFLSTGQRIFLEPYDNAEPSERQTYGRLVETGLIATLKQARFTVVVDTCTYVTTIMRDYAGAVMTNSGKWAHYAPGNLGVDVAFGTLVDCLNSAARGRVTRRRP